MRAPFQVLILPYRHREQNLEYAIFKRSDFKFWQFIAGGGEDKETKIEAACRELREEIGLTDSLPLLPLDSICTIPRYFFTESLHWPADLYVVPEYCFGIELNHFTPQLSEEHLEFRWVVYEKAFTMLQWDSNKNALWELRERLKQR